MIPMQRHLSNACSSKCLKRQDQCTELRLMTSWNLPPSCHLDVFRVDIRNSTILIPKALSTIFTLIPLVLLFMTYNIMVMIIAMVESIMVMIIGMVDGIMMMMMIEMVDRKTRLRHISCHDH